ncbi:hypothetical protein TRFO_25547 [Tritrichomonas foetus]|uniref:Uncharacterized protein n=1 Tax=Tritrichomonas foetus TaxID=1144522 RepID=A0A1J4K4Q8_9EUKA|nr:hypothetical protein TRFO_25547 [Tritrichomonas foetus]|eukprot:OHT06433.1 hypothetical protein TRFO_25547 [Tritrichomonas foetus]
MSHQQTYQKLVKKARKKEHYSYIIHDDYVNDCGEFLITKFTNYYLLVKENATLQFRTKYFDKSSNDLIFRFTRKEPFSIPGDKDYLRDPNIYIQLIQKFDNDPIFQAYLANIFLPSINLFYSSRIFLERGEAFIKTLMELHLSTHKHFIFLVAGRFIINSVFQDALRNDFIRNKALHENNEINVKDEMSDCILLFTLFFQCLHKTTKYQLNILKFIIQNSYENGVEFISQYVLSPIVESWEYSPFFVGTNILYEYENPDTMKGKCQLLEDLSNLTYSSDPYFFNEFFKEFLKSEILYQDPILLSKQFNHKYLYWRLSFADLIIFKYLSQISANNEINIQEFSYDQMFDLPTKSILYQFKEEWNEKEQKMNDDFSIPPEYKNDYSGLIKAFLKAKKLAVDPFDYYEKMVTDDISRINAMNIYINKLNHLPEIKKQVTSRLDTSKLLLNEIKATKALTLPILLKYLFKFNILTINPSDNLDQILEIVINKCNDYFYDFFIIAYNSNIDKAKISQIFMKYLNDEKSDSSKFIEFFNSNGISIDFSNSTDYQIIFYTTFLEKLLHSFFIYTLSKIDMISLPDEFTQFKTDDVEENEEIKEFYEIIHIGQFLCSSIQSGWNRNFGLFLYHFREIHKIIFQFDVFDIHSYLFNSFVSSSRQTICLKFIEVVSLITTIRKETGKQALRCTSKYEKIISLFEKIKST